MQRSSTPFRILALALAAVISTALFATIAGSMPPDFDGSPNDARNGVHPAGRTEVAIVPSRIEVIGWRSAIAAADDARAVDPRS
jgi:hypothetical protein